MRRKNWLCKDRWVWELTCKKSAFENEKLIIKKIIRCKVFWIMSLRNERKSWLKRCCEGNFSSLFFLWLNCWQCSWNAKEREREKSLWTKKKSFQLWIIIKVYNYLSWLMRCRLKLISFFILIISRSLKFKSEPSGRILRRLHTYASCIKKKVSWMEIKSFPI